MESRRTAPGGILEAINGGHLHWSDFRENVLRPFRIGCVPSPTADDFPKSFLVQLQAAQKNVGKHDAQRKAWRLDVAAGRGLNSLAVFPPNLVPPLIESSQTLRCMLPRMSREGLPLRLPNAKSTLYELPTARPIYVFGFDMDTFPKAEQVHLTGALSATGVSIDYLKGEVCSSKTLCCPFLAFEKFVVNNKRQIETARNSCAITGAQCLRGQQQLFHKAFGSQTDSHPLITFTCALNNEHAVINYHYIGNDGDYNMAALCQFDLEDDEHFNTFQAWNEAIESWATTSLLPRIRGAISQVAHSHPTPPPSPTPTNSSVLSIDTKTIDVLSILNELRRLCPTKPWRSDSMMADTPINSSMAICGTPLPTREIRSLLLPRPSSSGSDSKQEDVEEPKSSVSPPTKSIHDVLSPLRTDLPPPSAIGRPRTLAQYRLMMSPSARSSFSPSTDSSTPISPCRPPTLSPCTPGPDMPMSSMNPILVLQRRLDVAVTEIQELRVHADELQEQLNTKTVSLEQRLESVSEKQQDAEKSARRYIDSLNLSGQSVRIKPPDEITEQEMRTPTSFESFSGKQYEISRPTDNTPIPHKAMPGHYELCDNEEQIILWSWPQTQTLIIWCLAMMLKDNNFILQVTILICLGLLVCYIGPPDTSWNIFVNVVLVGLADEHTILMLSRWIDEVKCIFDAAIELQARLDKGRNELIDDCEGCSGSGSGATYDTQTCVDSDRDNDLDGMEKRHTEVDIGAMNRVVQVDDMYQ